MSHSQITPGIIGTISANQPIPMNLSWRDGFVEDERTAAGRDRLFADDAALVGDPGLLQAVGEDEMVTSVAERRPVEVDDVERDPIAARGRRGGLVGEGALGGGAHVAILVTFGQAADGGARRLGTPER